MKTITVNGAQIAYSEVGPTTGTPVVLSHSLFFDHTMFDQLSTALAQRGYRVFAYDHRGQGASSRSHESEQTADKLALDAAQLIEALDLGRVHFAGNSLGGFVALRLAARRPDLLLSVTAIATSAEEEYALEALQPLYEELTANGGANVYPTLISMMFGDDAVTSESAMVKHWTKFMSELDPSIGAASCGVISRTRIIEELKDCQVPLLVIAGDQDHIYPAPISSDNIVKAAGGRAVVVPGCGHSVSLEDHGAVCELLVEHFASAQIESGALWNLTELAAACAADGVYQMMLVSAPINLPGGIGSPANAVALK